MMNPATWSSRVVLPRGQARPGAVGWVRRPRVACAEKGHERVHNWEASVGLKWSVEQMIRRVVPAT